MGVCELCYEGATVEEIAACEVDIDPDDMESDLLQELGAAETTVTGALLELPASN